MTRLLMITNEVTEGSEYGLRDEFARLAQDGILERYQAVAPLARAATGTAWETIVADLCELARELRPSVLLVLSPARGDWTSAEVQRVCEAAGSPRVAYWEGDPWGRRNRPTGAMRAWLRAADDVYSIALGEQADLLRSVGAHRVRFIPHTYCHVQFAQAEEAWTPPGPDIDRKVVMVASRAGRTRFYSTVPGASGRRELVRRAARRFGEDFQVYGRGWRGPSAAGLVSFSEQARVIRSGGMSVNWDHYPGHVAYASDRLANSLIAGRPHITTRHPSFEWLPGEESGLFLADSPREVVETADLLRHMPADVRGELGRRAHTWVKDRLSDRQAARFMLAQSAALDLDLPEPWDRIAALGDGHA